MARWTIDRSDQGPVYLGYRLGHIRNDGRVFRALVYNKGALTLHMLRKLIGDDAFFRGLRRFYSTWRFKKAGTEDVKAAFELESNRDLDAFFDRWIYGSSLPRIKFSYTIEARRGSRALRTDRRTFEVPVTVTLKHAAGVHRRDRARHRPGDNEAHSDYQRRSAAWRERGSTRLVVSRYSSG